eukprot:CAMPEP_0194398078 /NCGR_PEP_ID=MMETSP0174-20130528/125903_1 /TAXON_ID=216777 /ORGANISM="Proboscia alata, Strain PI-D3" /LENGTH=459 /DNA_ID=CAMNT_0039194333 /DNA_START=197 /DNA_END=1576 /DNA_ORIENTATION=+
MRERDKSLVSEYMKTKVKVNQLAAKRYNVSYKEQHIIDKSQEKEVMLLPHPPEKLTKDGFLQKPFYPSHVCNTDNTSSFDASKNTEIYLQDNKGDNSTSKKITLPSHVTSEILHSGLVTLGVHHTRPSSDDTFEMNTFLKNASEIAGQLLLEIQTAGLRKGRETAIASSLEELDKAHFKCIEQSKKEINLWIHHADNCIVVSKELIDTARRQLTQAITSRDEAEERAHTLSCEIVQAKVDTEVAKFDALQARDSALECKEKARENLSKARSQFFLEMETEISTAKMELKHKSDEVRGMVEQEKVNCTVNLTKVITSLREENDELRRSKLKLEEGSADAVLKLKECKRLYEEELNDHQQRKSDDTKQFKFALQQAEQIGQEVHQMKKELERVNTKHQKDVEVQKSTRKQELNDVEEKVRLIISTKDAQLASALARALNAEQRAAESERVLAALDHGFEEI